MSELKLCQRKLEIEMIDRGRGDFGTEQTFERRKQKVVPHEVEKFGPLRRWQVLLQKIVRLKDPQRRIEML